MPAKYLADTKVSLSAVSTGKGKQTQAEHVLHLQTA